MAADQAPVERLKRRKDFLRAARGKRAGRPAFTLQVAAGEPGATRVGFTASKKTGNAPERNRIKRRLREAVKAEALALARGHDYVLVARREALHYSFARLGSDLRALAVKLGAVTAPSAKRPLDPSS